MFIHARIRYSILLIIPLILLILLPAVSAADEDRIFKENSKAIEALKQAIKIDPDNAKAHSYLGIAYMKLGMDKEVIEVCKQAIRIMPDDAFFHSYLGIAYSNLDMYKEAIEAYKQAIRLKPDDADAHYFLGLAYDSLNDRGSALEQYKILKNLDSELANKLFNEIYK